MRIGLIVAALVAALAIPVGLLVGRGTASADFRGSEPPDGLTMPSFELRDDRGIAVRSADLRGKAVAITFLDARCTEACPIIAAQVAQAVNAMHDDRGSIDALAVSVDPVDDTPRRVETFLRRYRAKGTLRYLDGSVGELRPVWKAFAIASAYDTGAANMHSAPVRVYDRKGRWRSTLHPGVDLTAPNLAHDLREALKSS